MSYGPPEHSAGQPLSSPSAPSGPGQHVDLAATYLPAAYDQGYHAQTSGHADTNYHTPVSSYGAPHGTDVKGKYDFFNFIHELVFFFLANLNIIC